MDSCFGLIFVILGPFFDSSILVDGEYVAISCMVVEWVSIDVEGCFLGC